MIDKLYLNSYHFEEKFIAIEDKINELVDCVLELQKEVALLTGDHDTFNDLSDKDVNGGECKHENIGYELPRDRGNFNAPLVCMDCGKNLVKDDPPEQEEWESGFDKRFVGMKSGFGDWLTEENGKKIKDFIQAYLIPKSKIKRSLKERVGLLEGFIKKWDYDIDKNRLDELQQLVDEIGLEEL